MAHKKGASSTRNGRDSNAQRLGVKRFGGQVVLAGAGNTQLDVGDRDGRLRAGTPPPPRYAAGVMAKYARLVSSAAHGAITG